MKFFVRILAVLIFGIFLSACFENPDCIDLRNNFVGFTFKKMYDGSQDTVGVLGVTVSGTDSVFYEFPNVGGPIHIPLDVSGSQQSFVFDLLSGPYSMILGYQSKTQFESVDCGPRFVLSDLNILQSNFDSVRVTSSTPFSEASGSNIDIYRCPITNNFKIAFRQLLANADSNGVELKEKLFGVGVDYLPFVFYPNSESSNVVLPLNTNATSTDITLDSKDGTVSTLNVNYAFQTAKVFEVCGDQKFIHDIQVNGTTSYDIIRLQKDSINDPPTTNVTLLKCPQTNLINLALKGLSGSTSNNYQINEVTAGYTTEVFYQDSLTSQLILPLDVLQDQTTFLIDFQTGPKQISFGYLRTQQVFHEQCNQTLFSDVQILSSDFTTPPVLKNDSIQFPTVVNFEIIND